MPLYHGLSLFGDMSVLRVFQFPNYVFCIFIYVRVLVFWIFFSCCNDMANKQLCKYVPQFVLLPKDIVYRVNFVLLSTVNKAYYTILYNTMDNNKLVRSYVK